MIAKRRLTCGVASQEPKSLARFESSPGDGGPDFRWRLLLAGRLGLLRLLVLLVVLLAVVAFAHDSFLW